MLTNFIKSELSVRYIEIIANNKGFSTVRPPDFGEDITICEISSYTHNGKNRYISTGRKYDLQLKSTTINGIINNDQYILYDLEAKTYNDLIYRLNSFPQLILVLFILPANQVDWVEITLDNLILRKNAYWYIPNNNSSTDNKKRKRIKISKSNIIDINFIENLFKGNII